MSTNTPGVIVVLGSVKAAQYGRARLDMHREGYRVRIVRLDDDDLCGYDTDVDDFPAQDEYLYSDCAETIDDSDGMERFLERIEFAPEDVVAVVALEAEWNMTSEEDHAFGFFNYNRWPHLHQRIYIVSD